MKINGMLVAYIMYSILQNYNEIMRENGKAYYFALY